MKTLHLTMLILLLSLALLSCAKMSFSQETQPTQENVKFIPIVPTDKSNITASIRVLSADIYCRGYAIDKTESGNDLVINIRTHANPGEKCPGPAESDIFLTENIGQLSFGVHNVKLLINGTEKATAKLYVSQEPIEIVSVGRYTDSQSNVHVVGEARNTASYPIKLIQLDIIFINGSQVMADKKLYTTMAVLEPEASSGFDLLLDSKSLQDVDYFARVTSSLKDTSGANQGLKLVVESASKSTSGFGIVRGSVSNTAGIDASQVKVVCVLYDTSGNVLDSVFDYTNPPNISKDTSSDFVLSSHYPITSQFIQHCNTESQELAALPESVPEFPIPFVTFLVSIGILMVLRFRTLVNNL